MDESALRHELQNIVCYTSPDAFFEESTEDLEFSTKAGEIVRLTSLIPTFESPEQRKEESLTYELLGAVLNAIDFSTVAHITRSTKDSIGRLFEIEYRPIEPGEWSAHSQVI